MVLFKNLLDSYHVGSQEELGRHPCVGVRECFTLKELQECLEAWSQSNSLNHFTSISEESEFPGQDVGLRCHAPHVLLS